MPFNPSVSESKAASGEIAKQMKELIVRGTADGWLFHGYESVGITVNPGCLAIFSGPRTAHYGVLVFYRDVAVQEDSGLR